MSADHNEVKPYTDKELGKKEQVRLMFNNISGRYDFLNHFLSLGIDRIWRKKAISLLKKENPRKILDVATGTGDFAIQSLSLNPEQVTGIDISEKMLEVGKVKIQKKGLQDKVTLQVGDSENLTFDENYFDAATVGFGVRNFENLEKGLKEVRRVLKPGGKFVILEFSKPRAFPFKQVYYFYFTKILPVIGSSVSKDNRAYSYLHESVDSFPEGDDFLGILESCGFTETSRITLMNGIASIYVGKKY
ncbi:MAG TPA: bifunctional demethylmenaquinone methyltransferase/2-methoxy-6-polyprenyl-1,4-benzoquinol methylase UbiE [Flavobacteriales bacterium]|nr:bifunctional demethylmenaquinone methyltransferase/2-methoxy-6-polyprenyl-1,4-benzoquinol methylase UbiE [Flavobacteriales bacterium]